MRQPIVLVIGTFLLGLCALAEEPKSVPSMTAEQALQKLANTEWFSFGGVGFAGTISEGERAFDVIVAQTNAVELFTAALKKAKPEGQMYALCGIHRLAPKKFVSLSQPILDANSNVNTMTGCLAAEQPASKLVATIATGAYDAKITPKPLEKPSPPKK